MYEMHKRKMMSRRKVNRNQKRWDLVMFRFKRDSIVLKELKIGLYQTSVLLILGDWLRVDCFLTKYVEYMRLSCCNGAQNIFCKDCNRFVMLSYSTKEQSNNYFFVVSITVSSFRYYVRHYVFLMTVSILS